MTEKEAVSAWKNGSAAGQNVIKISQGLIAFLCGFAIGFFAVAIFFILKGDVSDNEVCVRIRELIIAACVMGVTALIIYEFYAFYSPSSCADWLTKNNAKLSQSIKEISVWAGAPKLSKDRRDYEIISSGAYLAVSPDDRSEMFGKAIMCGFTAAIIGVCVGICLTQNVDELIRCKVYEGEFSFKYGAFIPAAAFTAVYVTFSAVCHKRFLKSKSAWLNSVV